MVGIPERGWPILGGRLHASGFDGVPQGDLGSREGVLRTQEVLCVTRGWLTPAGGRRSDRY